MCFVDDGAVKRDVADELRLVADRLEDPPVVVEEPDVVQDEDHVGRVALDHGQRLECAEHIAAVRIGRVHPHPAIVNQRAGIADAEVVDVEVAMPGDPSPSASRG